MTTEYVINSIKGEPHGSPVYKEYYIKLLTEKNFGFKSRK